ncbi:uncharacterized protein LOC117489703 isoform X8 [Trematomus bernacchii]|uniref:uncharacterized protein LOC117489703 isoform X8 n=1 Tax=Trematomus bernacchii TaxID=40690 RepID=UPI00146E07CB|nr:uncharacterized protein LOC117489703 isoform X8 [Trematomus bernacchii]
MTHYLPIHTFFAIIQITQMSILVKLGQVLREYLIDYSACIHSNVFIHFIFLNVYLTYKRIFPALLPPTLKVNSPEITETDSVTLHCQTPPSVSVSHCYFRTVKKESVRVFPCLKTLTGTELLLISQQSSPAEVQVECFYTVNYEGSNHPSPHSDTSFISIHSQKPQMSVQHFPGEQVVLMCTLPGSADHDARCNLYFGENNHPVQTTTSWKKRDKKNWLLCRFIFTIDDFLTHLPFLKGHDASCDYSLGSEANSLSPRSDGYSLTDIVEKEPSKISAFTTPPDIVEKDTRLTKTMLTSTMTTVRTVISSFTPMTTTKQTPGVTVGSRNTGSFINTSIKPVKPTQGQNPYTSSTQAILSPVTPETPSSETWTWKLVIVAASLGGVIVLGLAFLFTKRTTERCAAKRTQANVTDDLMCMRKLDHGGSLPAGNDEAYSMIPSVPAAVCLTGPEKTEQASLSK